MARYGMRIKCPHCGYAWTTRSMLRYVTCPSCLGKVWAEKNVVEEVKVG